MNERERFTPSDLQARAIREIKDWFLHRTAEQQVFRVFGYAGVGKMVEAGVPLRVMTSAAFPVNAA